MGELPPLEQAELALRRHILMTLDSLPGGDGPDFVAWHLSALVAPGCTKEMARAVCRDMRGLGFVEYHRALWTDEGEPAGSGYAITAAGRHHLWNDLGGARRG
ncbi:hypothetical protein KL86PLE_100284 [uncultured Pleomorphomonas sp.]|uniref:Uncharacterized protein n=1 Tax=uncultured Pleomorphomonas sp. TaxID=442121 RepID=A0A212L2M4_9HYPH|nr:hypothetical protein [uncultured Pleomorphomonas sp.]SCM71609.1 hypothetical protein KL86PLE_100284 [uncultured Pleomorphomonas sp.]